MSKKSRRSIILRRDPPRKVAICTPCDDEVKVEYCQSVVGVMHHTVLARPKNLAQIGYHSMRGSVLPALRHALAHDAIASGATHILWVDSDMNFPHDTVLRFLQSDLPLVGINAMTRRPPYTTTAEAIRGQRLKTGKDSTGLEKVVRMGFGLVWMATEILEKIPMPWFDMAWDPATGKTLGEDFHFFDAARKAGFEAFVDHDLSKQVGHVGKFEFNPLLAELMESTP